MREQLLVVQARRESALAFDDERVIGEAHPLTEVYKSDRLRIYSIPFGSHPEKADAAGAIIPSPWTSKVHGGFRRRIFRRDA